MGAGAFSDAEKFDAVELTLSNSPSRVTSEQGRRHRLLYAVVVVKKNPDHQV